MKAKRYRLGVVGAGNIGKEHIDYLVAFEDVSIVAICDTNLDARRWAVGRTGAREFVNYLDMLEQMSLDVILVCTPHNAHTQVVLDAARYGVHIFKEKPLARTLLEAHSLLQAVETYKVKFGVSAQRRFHSTYSRAEQVLNRCGEIFLVRAQHIFDSQPPDFGWRGKQAAAGGGAILDTGYHMIDLICLYFGLPDEVFAYSTAMARPDIEYDTEDSALISFRYSNGMMGSILVSRATMPCEEGISIHGSHGTLSITRTDMQVVDKNDSIVEHITAKRFWETTFREQFRDFLNCVTWGQKPKCSAYTHVATMAFVEAAYSSQQQHKPVKPLIEGEHELWYSTHEPAT